MDPTKERSTKKRGHFRSAGRKTYVVLGSSSALLRSFSPSVFPLYLDCCFRLTPDKLESQEHKHHNLSSPLLSHLVTQRRGTKIWACHELLNRNRGASICSGNSTPFRRTVTGVRKSFSFPFQYAGTSIRLSWVFWDVVFQYSVQRENRERVNGDVLVHMLMVWNKRNPGWCDIEILPCKSVTFGTGQQFIQGMDSPVGIAPHIGYEMQQPGRVSNMYFGLRCINGCHQ